MRYALLWSIVACLVAWQLAACATGDTKRYLWAFNDCAGKPQVMQVEEVTSHVPAVDCPRIAAEKSELASDWLHVLFMLIGTPLGCAIWANSRQWGVVVLPPWANDWKREHEFGHLRGYDEFGECKA